MSSQCSLKDLETQITNLKPNPLQITKLSTTRLTLQWEKLNINLCQSLYDVQYKIQKKNYFNEWTTIYCGNDPTFAVQNLLPKTEQQFRHKIMIKKYLTNFPRSESLDTASSSLSNSLILFRSPFFNEPKSGVETLKKKLSDTNEEDTTSAYESLTENYSSDSKSDGIDNEQTSESISLFQDLEKDTNEFTESLKDVSLSLKEIINQPKIESKWSDVLVTFMESEPPKLSNLFSLVNSSHYVKLESFIKEYPQFTNAFNIEGFSPLMIAASKGDKKTTELLINNGANIDAKSPSDHKTALMIAAIHRRLIICKQLIEKGASLNLTDSNGLSILHYAAESDDLEVVNYFLSRGCDVKSLDKYGWTPLFRAVMQLCRASVIKHLIDNGSNKDIRDSKGLKMIDYANRIGLSDQVKQLIDKKYGKKKNRIHFHFSVKT